MNAQTRNTSTVRIYITGECAHYKVMRVVKGEVLNPWGEWINRKWTVEVKSFNTREAAEQFAVKESHP